MSLPLRGPAVATFALVLALTAGSLGPSPASADVRRQDHRASTTTTGTRPHVSRAEARAVLARAVGRLRRDTARLRAGRPVGHGPSTEITTTLRDLLRARPSLSRADRRTADAILARPSDPVTHPTDPGADPVTYGNAPRGHYCPAGGIACVHWVSSGPTALPAAELRADADGDGVPDYVERVYDEARRSWSFETGTLGYRTPLADDGTASRPDNPDGRLDIYLADLGPRGLYGYCAPEGPYEQNRLPGYCVLDDDYARAQYGSASSLDPLRVTIAHELFHAVQFAYDVDEDRWFMEGTATWMEDQVYDGINDNHQYLRYSPITRPDLPVDYTPGFHQYGAFVFFTYLSERLGRDVVRRAWELAAAGSTNRYSLQAVRAAVQAHTPWARFMTVFAGWNTLPPGSYRDRAAYPAPRYLASSTLSAARPSTGWRRATRAHLSSAAVRVVPASRLAPGRRLVVDVDGPNVSHGSAALVLRRYRSGATAYTTMRLSTTGRGRTVIRFDRRVLSSVTVVVANTSTAMTDCGYIGVGPDKDQPEYSCAGRGVHDSGQTFLVRARLA